MGGSTLGTIAVDAAAVQVAQVMPPEETGRRALYSFLALVLYGPPSDRAVALADNFSDANSDIGENCQAFIDAFAERDAQSNASEYHDLFIGVGRGELLPHGSYYLTGFLNEKPLAELRGDLNELGFARAPGVKEPEDHIAALCDVMAVLIGGSWEPDAETGKPEFTIYDQETFFTAHLAPWAERFFADLASAKAADLYRHVGRIGADFMRIEREAFAMIARA